MRGISTVLRRTGAAGLFALLLIFGAGLALTGSAALDNEARAQEQGQVPGQSLGSANDSELWRAVRRGDRFAVSIPDKQAGVLVQSEGDNWRAFRNGPLSIYGAWGMVGMIVLLAVYFLLRGRIRIEAGPAGRRIERFNGIERFAHWLTATSFIILALTGLNLLYGRYLFGADPAVNTGDFSALHQAFAAITYFGKIAHTYVGFAFMVGLALIFVLWVRDNLLDKYDIPWLLKGGGLVFKGSHPPSRKFNMGQKIIFWIVILGGLSLAVSGISLMFPFEFAIFAKTFSVLNIFGLELPTELNAIEEMQLSQAWHAIVALFMVVVIIAHIYIGSLGMEDAFWAMGNGMVDENWAIENHSVWAEQITGKTAPEGGASGDDD
jgi:formate dehydrogenase subunit gamma